MQHCIVHRRRIAEAVVIGDGQTHRVDARGSEGMHRVLRAGSRPIAEIPGPSRDRNAEQVAGEVVEGHNSPTQLSCIDLEITHAEVEIQPDPPDGLLIRARVRTRGRTGVEMEALTAVAAAALTVYDMAKAVDKGMIIETVRLIEKKKSRKL